MAAQVAEVTSAPSLAEQVDFYRADANRRLDPKKRSALGQFMTPVPVAGFMASLFREADAQEIQLLDAGAGVGSLTAATVQELCRRAKHPTTIRASAYEIEQELLTYLETALNACQAESRNAAIDFSYEILREDFIAAGAEMLNGGLFFDASKSRRYTHAVLNPPYKKISSDSEHRRLLRTVGIETSNLYTAFLALATKLLKPGGELVAIIPRSFCNGPYFRPFRKLLLENMSLRRIHVFESREEAFKDDEVLQENIIFHAVKDSQRGPVTISSTDGPDFEAMTLYETDYESIVNPDDPDLVIHVITSELDEHVVERMGVFSHTLDDLGLEVSTGPVVDFRLKEHLRQSPSSDTVPLIYPAHFDRNFITWPLPNGRKPNAIRNRGSARKWLMPNGCYAVVRRFSAKEERRRVVAAVHDPARVPGDLIGFENHLNVYHAHHCGLKPEIAKGLAFYLNSSLVDVYFRQFNGHTQVNATDLRMLQYPALEVLEAMGAEVVDGEFPAQDDIDQALERRLQRMAKIQSPDPVQAKKKVEQAIEVLQAVGLPKGQQNERSALTLLALVGLEAKTPWSKSAAPLMGITPIMDFIRERYGKDYAPNTRETIRRQTMHQFVQAGLAVSNPDEPDRPTNSPHWCYQAEEDALALLRTYGTRKWKKALEAYLRDRETLGELYAKEREMRMLPLVLSEGQEIQLTPGKHSELIKAVIEEFGPRYAPGGRVLYVGDTGDKWGYFDEATLTKLGVEVDAHGKMPDAAIYCEERDWLFLIEAATSHGPVDPKRHRELTELFKATNSGLVYVTAFPTRTEMARYLADISWETEVWVADAPSHLIHFDGDKFLGPHRED